MLTIIFLKVDETDWFSRQVYWWNKLIVGRPPVAVHCGTYDGIYFYHSTIGGLVTEEMTKEVHERIVYQFVLPSHYAQAVLALYTADYRIYWWRDIPRWVFKLKSVSCVTFVQAVLGWQITKFMAPDELMKQLQELDCDG